MSVRFNLGEYEVLHALKSGGMGDVLLARRHGPGGFQQLCAIKTIRADLSTAAVIRTMFLDEARLVARLTHPAIAQVYSFGEHEGTLYMVMEYVPGLHFRRVAERRPPPAIVCRAMADACRGLHAAHQLRDLGDGHLLGVVHRDVSPDNLMLGFDGRVKVLDFGIALVKGRHAPVTEMGVLKGKPPYMSPEQVKNLALDRRADVFSACVVLHEMLTGQPLFLGDSIYAVARAVEHQVIEPPSALAGPLPPQLDDVVMAGLERDRDRRLSTAAALAEVLERIAASSRAESLESWVERELRDDREEHRRWLARTLAASGAMKAAGRPTGVVTALSEMPSPDNFAIRATGLREGLGLEILGGDPPAGTPITPTAESPPPTGMTGGTGQGDPPADPTPAPVDPDATGRAATLHAVLSPGDAPPPPRRRGGLVALLVLVVAAGLAALVMVMSRGGGSGGVAPGDPGDGAALELDGGLLDAPAADAALDAAPLDLAVDAGVRDAPRRRIDAGRRPPPSIDAGRAPARVDAAVPVTAPVDAGPTGTGYLAIKPRTPYVNVRVDGADWGASPVLRRALPAGAHTVELIDVASGKVETHTVRIAPGATVKL